ncbi:hypothetical protein OAO18_07290 [Francisellaceae bacterium]|nr:hypothetical protein [Francisellaceae bacterium]
MKKRQSLFSIIILSLICMNAYSLPTLRFTGNMNPYYGDNSLNDMNYRTTLKSDNPAFNSRNIIATSQPWSLAKAKLVLKESDIQNPKEVTMIDLRSEFHAYVHIDKPLNVNIPELGYDMTMQEGWYDISTLDDAEGEVTLDKQQKLLNDIKQYINTNKSLPITVKYKSPTVDNPSAKEAFTYSYPVDDIKFEQDIAENYLGINYIRVPVKDWSPISPEAADMLVNYYNTKMTPVTWIHCWGGIGRTGQAIGVMLTLILKPNTWAALSSNIVSFNNNSIITEEKEQVQFVYNFWEKHHSI